MLVVGVDPGIRGAIATLDTESRHAAARLMPIAAKQDREERDVVDEDALLEILGEPWRVSDGRAVFVYERLHALPPKIKRRLPDGRVEEAQLGGVLGNYNRGVAMGMIRTALAALRVPRDNRLSVIPQTWQRMLLYGLPCGGDTKAQAIWLALRLFPDVSLFASTRSRSYHDGIADALCLCEYGKRIRAGDHGRQMGLLPIEGST